MNSQAAMLARHTFAGALAGLVGSWVMVKMQNAVLSAENKGRPSADVPKHRESGMAEHREESDATVQLAQSAARAAGQELSQSEKKRGGELIHYAFGAAAGAAYGAAAADNHAMRAGSGTFYGLAIWLAADLVALPALGLAPPAHRRSAERLALGATAHLVYGAVLEAGVSVLERSAGERLAPSTLDRRQAA
jgi:putative membrane protein